MSRAAFFVETRQEKHLSLCNSSPPATCIQTKLVIPFAIVPSHHSHVYSHSPVNSLDRGFANGLAGNFQLLSGTSGICHSNLEVRPQRYPYLSFESLLCLILIPWIASNVYNWSMNIFSVSVTPNLPEASVFCNLMLLTEKNQTTLWISYLSTVWWKQWVSQQLKASLSHSLPFHSKEKHLKTRAHILVKSLARVLCAADNLLLPMQMTGNCTLSSDKPPGKSRGLFGNKYGLLKKTLTNPPAL